MDNTKHAKLCIIGISEGGETKKGIKNVFEEIIAKNSPNLKKATDIQVQEAQRVLNKMNSNRSIPTHIIIEISR